MFKLQNPKSNVANPVATVVLVTALAFAFLLCGCTTSRPSSSPSAHRFDFQRDTFAFPNELRWEYFYDANGKWTTRNREPKPSYSQHCFVLARSTRQFFLNARFAPQKPLPGEHTYRQLIRRVVSTDPRH